ncbi:kinetochore Sim4 complex subunit Fta4 [Ampelomyces quisqualis]|uniref:Kinetochore Sim4 complex subunit Fta4 n=1 Tax=Ampelomyces quisqualis TaxID=50730 RepID=A0A6A5QUW7_AMPQU|nr:kinetochore Sim4 complex subunit Fta4 [Ampelomyces quisqualis]
MSSQETIIEQKKVFLQSRKQLLSRGIPPSERLRAIAEDGGIELSVLKGVLDKVNRDLKQHSRKVYSRQMIEHVAEQIDMLYWESGARDIDEQIDAATDAADSVNALYQHDDLTQDDNIAKLPTHWDSSADPSSSHTQNISQDDYLASVSRLQDLAARRQMAQNKLNTYRTLLSLLEPYRKPKENIQPNLVWKDSPLAPELAKMRTLAIRVAARVKERFGDVQVPATAEDEEDVDMDDLRNEGKRKVDRVLDDW